MQDDLFEYDPRCDLLQQSADALPDAFGKLLGGRDDAAHPGYIGVKVLVVDIVHNLLRHRILELAQIHDHAGLLVERTGDADLKDIVVTMSCWICAEAEYGAVFRFVPIGSVEAMASAELKGPGDREHGTTYDERPGLELVGANGS